MKDTIHHIAIQVKDIARSVEWYTSHYACEVSYQDDSWTMIEFANTSLALVIPEQHPYHLAITTANASPYGTPAPHRDGTRSVYIQDPDGNNIEMLELPPTDEANT